MLRSVVRMLLTVAVAVLAMAIPSSAFALETYVPVSTFGGVGSGDGQLELREHSGVAVDDPTGNIYVADTGNHRIDEFDPSKPEGERFVRAFGADVGGAGVDVCTTGCVAGTSGSGPGSFEEPRFIAVDNAGGASQGDVYVGDSASHLVSKFDTEGSLITSWGAGGQIDGSTATGPFTGPFGELAGIAVDAAGNLDVTNMSSVLFRFASSGAFLTDFENPRGNSPFGLAVNGANEFFKVNGEPTVQRFDAVGEGSIQVSVSPEGGQGGQPAAGVAADQGANDLFVAYPGGVARYSFSPSGEVVGTGCNPTEASLNGLGCPFTEELAQGSYGLGATLAVNSSTHAVIVGNLEAGRISLYQKALVPDVKTLDVSTGLGVKAESANLPGTISAAGGSAATCDFEYTPEATFEVEGFTGAATTPCIPAGPFAGTTSTAVSGEASGLTSGVGYVFRIVGHNAEGSIPGNALSLTAAAPPTITSGPIVNVGGSTAQVASEIVPNESRTEFFVEYTTATDFAQHGYTAAMSAPVPAATLPLVSTIKVNIRPGQATYRNTSFAITGGRVAAGDTIRGQGIPNGTHIEVVNATELILSKAPTESANQASLTIVGPQPAVQQISGLDPFTEYHYRLVARNAAGTTESPDATFSTAPATLPGLPDGRVYELVSPATKLGEVIPVEPKGSLSGNCEAPNGTGCVPGGNQAYSFPMQASPDGDAVAFSGQPFAQGMASGTNEYVSHRATEGWATEGLSGSTAATGEGQGFEAISEDLGRAVTTQISPTLSAAAPEEGGVGFQNIYLRTADGFTPLVDQPPPHRQPGQTSQGGFNTFKTLFAAGNSGTEEVPAFSHLIFEANDALTGVEPGTAPAAPEVEEGDFCHASLSFSAGCDLYDWFGGRLHLINVLPGNTEATADAVIGSAQLAGPEQHELDFDHAVSADGSRIFWSEVSSGQVYVRIGQRETKKVDNPGTFVDASDSGSKVLLDDGCVYDLVGESCLDLTAGHGGFVGLMGATASLSTIYFVDTAVLPGSAPNQYGAEAVGGENNAYKWSGGTWTYLATLAPGDAAFGGTIPTFGDWNPSSTARTAQVTGNGQFLAFMSHRPLTGYDSDVVGGSICHHGQSEACPEVFEYDALTNTLGCPSCNPTGLRPLGKSGLTLLFALAPSIGGPAPQNLPKLGEGRLFFESQDSLLPEDINGEVQDVYEWEPDGVGSCEQVRGCLSLISTGSAAGDSFFMNSTPTGSDAFIATRQALLPVDQNEQIDLYDAREGGGFLEAGPRSCSGEGCRNEVAAQLATPQAASTSAVPEETVIEPKRHKKKHHKKHHRHKNKKKRDSRQEARGHGDSKKNAKLEGGQR